MDDIAPFYRVINARRDVRGEFSGAEVDDSILIRVLGAAHQAPSVGMTQPWDFVLVKDLDIRSRFEVHVRNERENFSQLLEGERQETFDPIKIEGIMESSLGIVVTYDSERGGRRVLGRNTIDETGIFSVCLAIENLWLAATAEGYGVGWVSFYKEQFLADLLEITSPVRPVAWLCFGPITKLQQVPDLERFNWRGRRPLGDAIFLDRYGNAAQLDSQMLQAPFSDLGNC